MVGGLLLSQVLTLYTTPVIYIFFDRLAQRFSRSRSIQQARPTTPDPSRGRSSMNPSPAIHQSACRHHPADVRSPWPGPLPSSVLPVSPLPQVDYPTISVGATLPGASAEIMAASVATPLERQFGHIAGITEMTSTSSLGTTAITLQFDLSRNIDGAARDVEAAINAARTYLPANLPANPTYRKVNPADSPIMSHRPHLGHLRPAANSTTKPPPSSSRSSRRFREWARSPSAAALCLPSASMSNPTQLNSYGLTLCSMSVNV